MMMAMVQAMEYLRMRCHKALVCQSPQRTVISLLRGFEAAILCESVSRIPLQQSLRAAENFEVAETDEVPWRALQIAALLDLLSEN